MSQPKVKVERITEVGFCELMEAPHWDVEEQCLYYVDVRGQAIHRYCPATKKHTKVVFADANTVSMIVPVHGQKGKFLVGIDHDIVLVTWDGQSEKVSKREIIASVEKNLPESRTNDGKCDAAGRLWIGTMGEGIGYDKKFGLYNLENRKPVQRLQGIMLSNGLAWNLNNTKFYYVDTMTKNVDEFDYDLSTGNISNKKVLFSYERANYDFMPDGMTTDTDGNLWVSCFLGGCILKIDPKRPNVVLSKVDLPVKQTTSIAFGGPNLDELYVTTAKIPIGDVVLNGPENGGLYRITGLGVKGLSAFNAKI